MSISCWKTWKICFRFFMCLTILWILSNIMNKYYSIRLISLNNLWNFLSSFEIVERQTTLSPVSRRINCTSISKYCTQFLYHDKHIFKKRCSIKKLFLKISQNSQVKQPRIFKKTFFTEPFWTTASAYFSSSFC